MRPHIARFDRQGWEAIHLLSCPGDLRECSVTIACRELTDPPHGRTGSFEVTTKASKSGPTLLLGNEVTPDTVFSGGLALSKITGYSYKHSHILPKGAE